MMLVPAFALAAADVDRFVTAQKVSADENILVVPLEITNTKALVALDIPLKFSEGAILDKVTFTDRVKDFQIQIANIDNQNRTVVIGLISMVYSEVQDLQPGTGAVAELHFKLNPGVTSVEISPTVLQNPNHELTYYYNDYASGRPEVRTVRPEVQAGEVSMALPTARPTSYALRQNSPNPFNPVTVVSYDLPNAGDVKISVFNIIGQHITDLVNVYQEAGSYQVSWDGKDNTGASVASGVYFYRIKTDQFSDTKKMVLLK